MERAALSRISLTTASYTAPRRMLRLHGSDALSAELAYVVRVFGVRAAALGLGYLGSSGLASASGNTVAAYRDAWRLLLRHTQDRTGKQPCQLDLADLDAPFVAGFLDHLEHDRCNSVRTRDARLASIRSFFRYAALCHPEPARTSVIHRSLGRAASQRP